MTLKKLRGNQNINGIFGSNILDPTVLLETCVRFLLLYIYNTIIFGLIIENRQGERLEEPLRSPDVR